MLEQTVRTDWALRGATRATYLVFGAAGFAFASWAARIPQVRDRLDLDSSALGLVLLVAGGRVGGVAAAVGVADRAVRLAAGRGDDGGRARRRHGGRGTRLPGRGRARRGRAVRVRVRQRRVGRRHERAGRRGGAGPGAVDHVPLPRRLEPRHGRRRAHRRGDGRARRPRHRPPDRCRARGRARRARSRPGRSSPTTTTPSPTTTVRRTNRFGTADGVARAPDAPRRRVRPRLRVRRGSRQRLDQRRDDRRLRAGRRDRHARVRHVPGRHDRRSVVRHGAAGPPRPGAGRAGLGDGRHRRRAGVRLRSGRLGRRSSACCSGAPGRHSASRWG